MRLNLAAWSAAQHIHSYKNRLDINMANQIDAQHIYRQTVAHHKCIYQMFYFIISILFLQNFVLRTCVRISYML